jgi:bacterial/archaeal transporter family-2 protein
LSSDDGSGWGETARGPVPRWLFVIAAVLLGALISVQARVSADLAKRSDVYNAAWITVATGAVILLVIIAFSRKARHGFRSVASGLRSRTLPWWALVGGLCGMFFVVTQGTAAGALGLAMFGMAVVAGQVIGGLVFDWIGLTGDEKRRPTTLRVLGSLLAIAAVTWGAIAGEGAKIDVLLILMAFAAGIGLALSAGVTGRVQATSNSVITSGMVNHTVGLTVIVLILTLTAPGDLSRFQVPSPAEPWLYVGGMIGPIGVALSGTLVRILGVLLLGLGMVAGQLIGALVLELIVPTASGGIQPSSVIGIALTLVAVGLTSLDGRGTRAGAGAGTRGVAAPERGRGDRSCEAGSASGSAAAG